MKKLFLLACLALFAVTATTTNASAQVSTAKDSWIKSTTGMWVGKDNNFYKLYPEQKVGVSKNGTDWAPQQDGMWQDKDGKWYKIAGGKLMKSDTGKIWAEAPAWTWQGYDSKWYKFDSSWNLMVKK